MCFKRLKGKQAKKQGLPDWIFYTPWKTRKTGYFALFIFFYFSLDSYLNKTKHMKQLKNSYK